MDTQHEEITRPSRFKVWWAAIRPATLWAGAAPVFVGAGLSVQAQVGWDQARILTLLSALIGAILIQIGCNLVNDYADFERGTDDEHRIGPARAAAQGWLSASDLKRGAAICLGGAALLGIYLTMVGGLPILALGIASILCAYAYTAGPFPLAYLGLGDLFVMLFFGLGAVGGTTWLLTSTLTWVHLTVGWSVGALATAILVVNNLRDRVGDEANGKRTLAVRFGARVARLEYTALLLSALVIPLGFAAYFGQWRWIAPWMIAPLAIRRIRSIWTLDGPELNPLLGQTAQLELLFCLALTLGLCAGQYGEG